MTVQLFAGIPVSDYARALDWYERLLGSPPAFEAHPTESVWELADGRYVYVDLEPQHAGHARLTLFVEDLDATIEGVNGRGLEPATRETYGNGVRKVTYRDPDGNEVAFGGGPTDDEQ